MSANGSRSALAAFFMLACRFSNAADSEPAKAPPIAPTDCAVEGESLEARLDRLRTAVRLAEAELLVKRGRKHPVRK